MKLTRSMMNVLVFWALDFAGFHTHELCWKYGGTNADGTVRVCDKPRWHADSHTFANWTMP